MRERSRSRVWVMEHEGEEKPAAVDNAKKRTITSGDAARLEADSHDGMERFLDGRLQPHST